MIVLSEGQEKVVNEAVDWFYNGSKQIFEISGPAGTGKSVVLYEIVKRLKLKEWEVLPCAYTGAAAIVMRMKGFKDAKSLHSTFYHIVKTPVYDNKNDPFNLRMNTQFNIAKYTYTFEPLRRGEISKDIRLIVIDEGYMVPITMRKDILKHGIKVLVCGDANQLAPVKSEPAFLTGPGIHWLTEIMRQNADNPILYLANRAMKGQPIHCGIYGNNCIVIEDTELTPEILANAGTIICGTNRTRDMFNKNIRSLKRYPATPVYGDRIICRNNNWEIEQDGIALANGLAGFLVSPVDPGRFRDPKDKNIFLLDFLPDLLNKPFINLKANYTYLIADYGQRQAIKNDKFQKGELFEYSYALTTHLAQGSEYPTGIFYEEFLRPNIQNQLLYTGITRFKNSLIYVKKTRRYR